jgi:flagellar hook assembly protein FlgD
MKQSLLLAAAVLLPIRVSAMQAFPLKVQASHQQLSAETPIVQFQVSGPNDERATGQVLDRNGRSIARLAPAGPSLFIWDGHDHRGHAVPPGTYLIEIVEEPYLWNGAVTVLH